ncbi:hypothetical protein D9M68_249420 [compost metagenome]
MNAMVRLPLYALLSLTLHAALVWLLQGQWQAHAARLPAPRAMLVMLAPLEAPAVATPAAPSPPSPPTPPAAAPVKAPSKPIKPVEPPRQVVKAPRPEPRPKAPEPIRPAPPVVAAKPHPVSPANASEAVVATAPRQVQPAVEEVFSREPAFLEPPKQPIYPSQARRRNQQGVVLVEVRLDSRGGQRALKVLRSSGVDSLDRAALAAIAGWRFRPETHNGKAVPSRVHIPIQFALTASR